MNSTKKSNNLVNKLDNVLDRSKSYFSKALIAASIVASSCGMYSSNGDNLVQNDPKGHSEIFRPNSDTLDHHIPPAESFDTINDAVVQDTIVKHVVPVISAPRPQASEPVVREPVVEPSDTNLNLSQRLTRLFNADNIDAANRVREDFFSVNKSDAQRLLKVHEWYTGAVETKNPAFIDSLEMALFSNNQLYKSSNATLMTSPVSGIGAIKELHNVFFGTIDEPYITLNMVGLNGAVFNNEQSQKRDFTTTFSGAGNYLDLTDMQMKIVLSSYANWNPDEITVVRDVNNAIVHTPYSGDVNRHIIVNRLAPEGVLQGEVISGNYQGPTISLEHPRWPIQDPILGSEANFPLRPVLVAMGYNLDLVPELSQFAKDDSKLISDIQSALDNANKQVSNLSQEKDSLAVSADSLARRATSFEQDANFFEDAYSKLNFGILLGAGYDLSSDLTLKNIVPEIGIYVAMNKFGFGLVNELSNTKLLNSEFTQTRAEGANRPPSVGATVRESSTKSYAQSLGIIGMLSYNIANNTSLFVTGGARRTIHYDDVVDHFWKELPGDKGQIHITEEDRDVQTVNFGSKYIPVVGLGASTRLLDRLHLYVRGSTELPLDKFNVNVGLKFDVKKAYNRDAN